MLNPFRPFKPFGNIGGAFAPSDLANLLHYWDAVAGPNPKTLGVIPGGQGVGNIDLTRTGGTDDAWTLGGDGYYALDLSGAAAYYTNSGARSFGNTAMYGHVPMFYNMLIKIDVFSANAHLSGMAGAGNTRFRTAQGSSNTGMRTILGSDFKKIDNTTKAPDWVYTAGPSFVDRWVMIGTVFDSANNLISYRYNGATDGTAEWNGAEIAVTSFNLGIGDTGTTRSDMSIRGTGLVLSANLADIQKLEGYTAWQFGQTFAQGVLNASHPYYSAAP